MRSFTLALVGLAALSHAMPTGEPLEERQTLGEPSTTFQIGNQPAAPVVAPDSPAPPPEFTIGKRDSYWLPDSHKSDKENIVEAELELQILQRLYDQSHSRSEKKAIQSGIRQIESYLRRVAGIKSISAPPGTTTTFTPGKRSPLAVDGTDGLDSLHDQFLILYNHYNSHPSLEVFLILQHIASILASHGRPADVIILGPASTHFQISSRQVFSIGNCDRDDMLKLLFQYIAISTIYGEHPPSDIRALKEAVYTILKNCGVDPEVGGIIPDNPVPGGPIVPNKPNPGGPLVPDRPAPGSPLTPSS